MFYFWSSGVRGDLWLSGDGIREAFKKMHPEAPTCSDVVLLGDRKLVNVTFLLEPGTSQSTKTAAEQRFLEFAGKLGLDEVQASWINEMPVEEGITAKNLPVSPFFWGGLFWVITAVVRMGISGTILATSAAFAAFSISALFTTRQGLEVRRWAKGLFERNA